MTRFDLTRRPLVIGIGGTTRAASSTERALGLALRGAEQAGARTRLFGGTFLQRLPHYAPDDAQRTREQLELIEAVRQADAIVIATPGYHGGVSGLVKNALDTLEELRGDARPYLDGRAVGCIVTAYGWQATGSVLTSLRSIVHALRGWPTPFGAGINTLGNAFRAGGHLLRPGRRRATRDSGQAGCGIRACVRRASVLPSRRPPILKSKRARPGC